MSDFYETVAWLTHASCVPGVFCNLLLVLLVKKFSRKDIGTFRYLLIVFALYDSILVILHSAFDPKGLTYPGISAAVLDFPYGSRFLTSFHYIVFMNAYAILIMHLLYRYWVVTTPYKIALFSSPVFILKIITVVAALGAIMILLTLSVIESDDSPLMQRMRIEFHLKYNHTRTDGWGIAHYWSDGEWHIPVILVSLLYDLIGSAIINSAIALAYLTHRHISEGFSLSPSTRAAQMQLLKTVCVQTFIPIVCVMIPYFINLTLPIFGITMHAISDSSSVLMSLFPTLDPLAVIILMKPYRAGLWTLVTGRKPENDSKVTTVTTSTNRQ